jgi:hypothetical protein
MFPNLQSRSRVRIGKISSSSSNRLIRIQLCANRKLSSINMARFCAVRVGGLLGNTSLADGEVNADPARAFREAA